jgi:DNA modification methylase
VRTFRELFTNFSCQKRKREMTYKILKGNSLDLLPTLADNSIDAIVTDPPYGLGNPDPDYIIKAIQLWASGDRSHIPEGKGFMGKSWDSFVPPPAIWDECLRVLKPGGHLLAFAGTRTYDLMGISIRMAGFEIRDSIGWVYGSGFPKSLDISKAIDKNNGKFKVDFSDFGNYVKESRESKGYSRKQLDEIMGTNTAVSWWEGRAAGVQLPSKEAYNRLKPILEMDNRFDSLIDWAEAEREVIGKKDWSNSTKHFVPGQDHTQRVNLDITAPSTPEAQQWQGWGTALKPALEPIVVARKPLIGTVAENVLTHGTGGLNIDASRITTDELKPYTPGVHRDSPSSFNDDNWQGKEETKPAPSGRWPANLILDEYTAELLDEQSGQSKSPAPYQQASKSLPMYGSEAFHDRPSTHHGDSGGASRFFYVAKASKRDRNEGLEDLPEKGKVFNGKNPESAGMAQGSVEDKFSTQPAKNFHPTVKPTELMRYLVKLITPPGGTVLDPFTGSGSTGKAAILEGFDFIGIELTEDYWPIIEGRLKHAEAKVAEAKENIEAQPEGLF